MKPVIIYTMGRSRSTAVLQACRRTTQLNEPFDVYSIVGHDFTSFIEARAELGNQIDWANVQCQMSNSDSASKFFGTSLALFPPAQNWFLEAEETHEIFILLRNVRDVIWSLLLANKFGFHKHSEVELCDTVINDRDLFVADNAIDQFLRFYPQTGKIISFDSLPEDYFDYSKITHPNQNSQERKLQFITNLDEVERKIDLILDFRSLQWKEKTKVDIRF